ncbi:uncharacterized protein BYT42DRAFT_644402 [Radiomyces spectabilis]|uniref:uncharacterized protein n=1 Tax=Radiomyces spectabilis TaxID=64574 RepID=UPI002220296E|nr:uncharacterized protein BYT42DRAFT_644402 [Radiomyces spectabilis]KAI8379072.1 hypothetical protein BYT42DRAFT_644402 [Radiomyces spectabilis]
MAGQISMIAIPPSMPLHMPPQPGFQAHDKRAPKKEQESPAVHPNLETRRLAPCDPPDRSNPSSTTEPFSSNKNNDAPTSTAPPASSGRASDDTSQNISDHQWLSEAGYTIKLPSIPAFTSTDYESGIIREVHHIIICASTIYCISILHRMAFSTWSWLHSLDVLCWSTATLATWWHPSETSWRRYLHILQLIALITLVLHVVQVCVFWKWRCSYGMLPTAVSVVLCYIARRMYNVNDQQADLMHKHWQHQQTVAHNRMKETFNIVMSDRQAFFETIAQEIQDTAFMTTSLLDQFSPSMVLNNIHELLSACSIAIPIASISAVNTAIHQIYHVSSNLYLMSKLLRQSREAMTAPADVVRSTARQQFDLGDLVQSIGDTMAGMALKFDVHLVVNHCDNGLYYANVLGDEGAIKHAVINLVRNILEGCTPGACIELGLNVAAIESSSKFDVTIEIIHTMSPAIPLGLNAALLPNANFTVHLLEYIGASLSTEALGDNRTKFDIKLTMEAGEIIGHRPLHIDRPSQMLDKHLDDIEYANEPSSKELLDFIGTLKGSKMVLHAPEQSIFAKHLTSCLASWNVDISHIPVSGFNESHHGSDTSTDATKHDFNSDATSPNGSCASRHSSISSSVSEARSIASVFSNRSSAGSAKVPSPAIEEEHLHSIPPAFILIDDDILSLKRKLRECYGTPASHVGTHPSPARGHRSLKSNIKSHGHQAMTTGIIFFTSLKNFKYIRDTIHWLSMLPNYHPASTPRVVVVPKPAGPRRFLTALYTAAKNVIVEPQFIPIATSPVSPVVTPLLNSLGPTTPSQEMWTLGRNMHGRPRLTPGPATTDNVTERDNYFANHRRTSSASTPGRLGNASSVASLAQVNQPASNSVSSQGSTASASSTASDSSKRRLRSHSGAHASGRRSFLEMTHSASTAPPQPPQSPKEPRSPHLSNTTDRMRRMSSFTLQSPRSSTAEQEETYGTENDNGETKGTEKDLPKDEANKTNEVPSPERPEMAEVSASDSMVNLSTSTPAPSAETDKNHQSRFKLSNRKRKAKNNTANKSNSPPINVLIVEDNMINQAILSTWMKKHKIKCSVASNGQEAVDKWKSGGFHLVLMDIQLPVMNGLDATRMIRTIEREQRTGVLPMTQGQAKKMIQENIDGKKAKDSSAGASLSMPSVFRSPVIIVALTASSLESDRQAALAAGCNDFLTKPVSLEWLEKKITEWGCMQALIDFEGWRMWKRSADAALASANQRVTAIELSANAAKSENAGAANPEKEQPTSAKTTSARKGVLLRGASELVQKRRTSSMLGEKAISRLQKLQSVKSCPETKFVTMAVSSLVQEKNAVQQEAAG